jgi:F0F1-type ATP synthase assembly protein I
MALKKKQPSKWLVFLNIPFQMGIIIAIGVFAGAYLDEKLQTKPLFIIVLSLSSIALSFYNIMRQLKNLQKHD